MKINKLYSAYCKAQERHSYLVNARFQCPVETAETRRVFQEAIANLQAADIAYETEAAKNPAMARRAVLSRELKEAQTFLNKPMPTAPRPEPTLPATWERDLLAARGTKRHAAMLEKQDRHTRARAIWANATARYQEAQRTKATAQAAIARLMPQLEALPVPVKVQSRRRRPITRAEMMGLGPYIRERYTYDPTTGRVHDNRLQRPINTAARVVRVQRHLLPMHMFMGLLVGANIDPHNGVRLASQVPHVWAARLLFLEENNHKIAIDNRKNPSVY